MVSSYTKKGGAMEDKDFQNLIESGLNQKAKISEKKLHGDVKNPFHIFLQDKEKSKPYIQVAYELSQRLKKKGLYDDFSISMDKLTSLEKKAVSMLRNDSTLDTEILKGDNVLSIFLMLDKIIKKHQSASLKPKRMQLTDKQIYQIIKLKYQGLSLRKISEKLKLNRITVTRVINHDYVNKDDIKRIEHAEHEVRSSGL